MSSTVSDRKKVEAMAEKLRANGWTPAITTISSMDTALRYSLGVLVKIGDERLQWEKTARNPAVDFFSIANIANGVTQKMARKPVGFNWSMAGTESVMLLPNYREGLGAFLPRVLKHNGPDVPAQDLKHFRVPKTEAADESAQKQHVAGAAAQEKQLPLLSDNQTQINGSEDRTIAIQDRADVASRASLALAVVRAAKAPAATEEAQFCFDFFIDEQPAARAKSALHP